MERLVRTFQGGHTDPVAWIAVSSDGKHLLSASRRGDDGAKLWRIDSGELLHKFSVDVDVDDWVDGAVTFSPDGKLALAGTHRQHVRMWDMETRELLGAVTDPFPLSFPHTVVFAGDGSFILSAHGIRYRRYDLSLNQIQVHELERGLNPIDSPSLSHEGRFVASVHIAPAPNIVIYDLLLGQPVLRLPGDTGARFNVVKFSPDGKFLLSGDVKGRVKLLDGRTRELIRSFDPPGHSKIVTSVDYSSNGRLALSGSEDNTAKLWEVSTGREIHSFNHGGGFVNCVVFL